MFALKWIWKGMKWLGAALVAPVTKLRQVRGIGRILLCIVHALAVLTIVGLLGFANWFFGLDTLLRTPYPILRMAWLPILFLLSYALIWLGWYTCRAIAYEQNTSPFPDIHGAWQRATAQLAKAGVDLAKTPLYLLVGRPRGRMHDLLHAAGTPLVSAPTADDANAPVQIFANREAIFVSCSEVSLLGRQAEMFASAIAQHRQLEDDWSAGPRQANADVALDEIPIESTPGGAVATATLTSPAVPATQDRLAQLEGHVATLVDEHEGATVQSTVDATAIATEPTIDLQETLLKDAVEVKTISARLRYLCELIVEARQPHVPINSVLLLASSDALDCEETAGHLGVLASEDLDAINDVTKVHCPHVMLICDVEESPGGKELIARFPEEQRHRRLGVRLPNVSRASGEETADVVVEGAKWLCDSLLPPLVHRLLRSPESKQDESDTLRSNTALYQFLFMMRRRRDRLARMLRRSVFGARGRIYPLAGCYLAATGEDSGREQGFAEAVFAQLPEFAQEVSWTDEAIARDRRQRSLARCGYAALAALAAVLMIAAFGI